MRWLRVVEECDFDFDSDWRRRVRCDSIKHSFSPLTPILLLF